MPIVRMTTQTNGLYGYNTAGPFWPVFPPGARSVLGFKVSDGNCGATESRDTVAYETHHGLCLHEEEINRYDDSDWVMVVWNPREGRAERVLFASTRFSCAIGFGSHADATPEVRTAYEAWMAEQAEQARADEARTQEMRTAEHAAKAGLTVEQVRELEAAYRRPDEQEKALRLLTSKLRSPFRIRLREQVLLRCRQPAAERRHATPLSPRQLACL